MALGRYLVEAVALERQSVSELARRHGVSRYWIYKLVKRFHEGGFPALEPRSRRSKTCAHETAATVQAEILQLRQELSEAGYDAGPQTIAHHLIGRAEPVPSVATIWRILKRHAWQLADGSPVEILNIEDYLQPQRRRRRRPLALVCELVRLPHRQSWRRSSPSAS